MWRLQSITENNLSSSNSAFREKWAKWKAFGRTCTQKAKDQGESIAYHMNTTPLVLDLLEIIERHGQWREKEAQRLVLGSTSKYTLFKRLRNPLGPSQRDALARNKWQRGKEKIMFWGLSYGTILGQTFAAMYPDRIERFVLDGVSAAEEHYSGKKLSSLRNTDKSFEMLFAYCFEAGPERCPLWMNLNFHDADELKTFVMRWVALLEYSSLPVPGSDCLGPTSISVEDVYNLIRENLYYPMSGFPLAAKFIAQMMNGNGTDFALYKLTSQNLLTKSREYPLEEYRATHSMNSIVEPREETFTAIQCTDFPSITEETQEDFKQYLKHMHEQSYIAGDDWAELRMRCNGWNIRPSWRYPGECQFFHLQREAVTNL